MLNIVSFLTYALVTTFTPGPNNIMAMSNAGKFGFKKSIGFNFGVFAGFIVIMAACSAFSFGLYRVVPVIKPYMTAVGATYMLWLAWKTLLNKSAKENARVNTTTFLSGMLFQFINPKAILYGLTITSTFLVPYYQSPVILLLFSVFLAFLGFVSTCCWALCGSLFQRIFTRNAKAVSIVMAVLLVYCAVSLFFE